MRPQFRETIPWQPRRMPLGCDQQGRYPEAAHAASEVHDDDREPDHARDMLGRLLVCAVLLVAVAAAVVIWGGV